MSPENQPPSSLAEQLDQAFTRPSGRQMDQMREIRFQTGIAPHANGSVLCSFGNTQVICAAMIEDRVPGWMRQQKVEGGWLTAEYSMLPYSTLYRKDRPISKGKQDGRNIEIQRLIGRSLRAVLHLKNMPDKTLWIDCDVLRADGGTRTASITGAWLATRIAINGLLERGKLEKDPIVDHLAAVSNFVIVPLTFLSGTFYDINVLVEPFKSAAYFDPIFFLIDGFRYGLSLIHISEPTRPY